MQFAVLGPIRVAKGDGQVVIGARLQRVTLALLLVADGEVVARDRLIDQVWAGQPPATARKALQGHVHQLRTLLGDVIETRPSGYCLPDPDLDVTRFRALHAEARELLDVDPSRAGALLDEALELWHGTAYSDLRDHPIIDVAGAGLDQERVAAVGDRLQAQLGLGRHRHLVAELEALVAEHPFHERFRAQHMLALYRCGRQVEALQSYERHRELLASEMGLDPAAEVRDLERRILQQDPALDATAAAEGAAGAVRGYELRERIDVVGSVTRRRAYQRSIGREVVLSVYPSVVADDPAVVAGWEHRARTVAGVQHPHVLPVIDTWREPGRAYQVGPWLAGGPLAQRLRPGDGIGAGDDHGELSLIAGLQVLRDVAEALDAAARVGVHHGSVGAHAVWLDEDGRAYLGDFTLERPDARRDPRLTDRHEFATLAARVLRDAPSAVTAALDRLCVGPAPGAVQLVRALEHAAGLAATVEAADAHGSRRREDRRNPYKGLRAFTETDAEDFHGRESLVDLLASTVERHRLVAVVGASGSGKSSAVRAGLLPRLRATGAARRMLVTSMFPGQRPFEELETALLRVAVDRSAVDGLAGDPRGLVRSVKRVCADDTELLLVVDQFEELYTMVPDLRRERFIACLVAAVMEPHTPLRVVLTLRGDFFDRPLADAHLGPLFREGLVPVTPPEPDELARAIAAPARAAGVTFADGLVGHIVEDVGSRPGSLPLLQHALTQLFDERASDVITLADYTAAGGVPGAVGQRAEALHDELSPGARSALRQLMLRLVSIQDSADDLRRRVPIGELRGLELERSDLDRALRTFVASRLLVLDRDPATRVATVEITHEAVLREWPRLVGWIDDHRDDLRMRRRLTASVEDWEAADEDETYLARGRRLAELEGWARTTSLALRHSEHAFLEQSIEAEEQELATAASRRRRVVAALSAASLVAVALAALAALTARDATMQREIADEQRRSAVAAADAARVNELARSAALARERDPELAMLLALEAVDMAAQRAPAALARARSELHQSTQATRVLWRADAVHAPGVVVFGDGSTLVTSGQRAGPTPVVDVRDVATGEVLGAGSLRLDRSVHALSALDDDRVLAAGVEDGTVVLTSVDVRTRRVERQVETDLAGRGVAGLMVDDRAAHAVVEREGGPPALVRLSDGRTLHEGGQGSSLAFVGPAGRLSEIDAAGRLTVMAPAGDGVTILPQSHDPGTIVDHVQVGGRDVVVRADTAEVVRLDEEGRETTLRRVPSIAGAARALGADRVAFPIGTGAVTIVDVDSGTGTDVWGVQGGVQRVVPAGDDRLVLIGVSGRLAVVDVSPAGHPGLRTTLLPDGAIQLADGASDDEVIAMVEDGEDRLTLQRLALGTGPVEDLVSEPLLGMLLRPETSLDGAVRARLDADRQGHLSSPWGERELGACQDVRAISDDGAYALVDATILCSGGTTSSGVMDVATGEMILDLGESTALFGDFGPPGTVAEGLVTINQDQETLGVWDLETGQRLAAIDAADSAGDLLLGGTFAADGHAVAVSSFSGTVRVMDVAPLRQPADSPTPPVRTWKAGGLVVLSLSLDEGVAAAGVNDDTVAMVDTERMVELARVPATSVLVDGNIEGTSRPSELRGEVVADAVELLTPAVLLDDGVLLYADGEVLRRLPVSLTDEVDLARSLLTRGWTRDECATYEIPDCSA